MLIPKYLQDISELVKRSKDKELIRIKCKCSHTHFIIFKYSEPENNIIKSGYNKIIREDNKLYLVKRNFFGKIVGKLEYDPMAEKKQRNIIKIKCEKCGSEYIVFDNYKNGYDATIAFSENIDDNQNFLFQKMFPHPLEVLLNIHNDINYEEFQDEFPNMEYDTYLNSFTNIDIYGVNSTGKQIRIHSEETA